MGTRQSPEPRGAPAATGAVPTLREWLREAPFTLALSSGFFGFFAHGGFLSVLEDEDLVPSAVCGSSAGALVGGLWCAGVSTTRLSHELAALKRAHFWDPAWGPGLLRGRLFRERLERLLPVRSFAACERPVSLSVYDVLGRRTRVVRDGPLAPAIHASCAVPFLFQPVWLERRPHYDGGIFDRSGLLGVPSGARVLLHHLESRSPWRRRPSARPMIPDRPSLVALELRGLPRLGPFALELGVEAFARARAATRAALARPVASRLFQG